MVNVQATDELRTVFQEAWWLEAAAGNALERAEVRWDGHLVANLPFVRVRKLGLTLLDVPPYTGTLGPILQLPKSKPAQRARNMHRAMQDLVEALPKHDRCHTKLEPDDPTAFSLALAGCSLGQQFTLRMTSKWNENQHWDLLDQATRDLLEKARHEVEVRTDSPFEALLTLSEQERGSSDHRDYSTLRRIAAEVTRRGQQTTLTAHLNSGAVIAAATVIWDNRTMYFWQSARNSRTPCNGVSSLLVWEALRLALEKQLIFDIDGFQAARFASRFAMQPAVRTHVQHLSQRGRTLQAAGRLLGLGGSFGVSS